MARASNPHWCVLFELAHFFALSRAITIIVRLRQLLVESAILTSLKMKWHHIGLPVEILWTMMELFSRINLAVCRKLRDIQRLTMQNC